MGREVARVESDDFTHWTKEEVVLEGLGKNLQPYAMPVFYYGGVYLGLVAIHNQKTDRVHTELTWSPDTKKWYRISPGTPLIPLSDKKLDYDYGCVYACAYPIFEKDAIKLYYGGSDWLHFGWRSGALSLATLRPDGFAGYVAKSSPAKIVTKEISYSGGDIYLNADINKDGYLNITVLDVNGNELAKAKSISEIQINNRLQLNKQLTTGSVKLLFEFANATVYSFDVNK